MNSFEKLLSKFQSLRALVIGDLMLDEYISGSASRISPEAPVIVIHRQKRDLKPGGAANVAQNIVALGAQVILAGVVGADSDGQTLQEVLKKHHLTTTCIVEDNSRVTTCKTRVLAGSGHQVLRIDQENDHPVQENIQKKLIEKISKHLGEIDVIVISDYYKGAVTEFLVQEVIAAALKYSIPIATNPKPRSISYYKGAASLLSLNRLEATECLNYPKLLTKEEAFSAAESLRNQYEADCLVLTLGGEGMIVASKNRESYHVPAPIVEVYDTAGAGDTVIAAGALGYAASGSGKKVFELAAQVSSCVVRHLGVATPTQKDLDTIRRLDSIR